MGRACCWHRDFRDHQLDLGNSEGPDDARAPSGKRGMPPGRAGQGAKNPGAMAAKAVDGPSWQRASRQQPTDGRSDLSAAAKSFDVRKKLDDAGIGSHLSAHSRRHVIEGVLQDNRLAPQTFGHWRFHQYVDIARPLRQPAKVALRERSAGALSEVGRNAVRADSCRPCKAHQRARHLR
jgi:hypothetical protein